MAVMCDTFLNAKRALMDAGELTDRRFRESFQSCQRVVRALGKSRLAGDLTADDLGKLRAEPAERPEANDPADTECVFLTQFGNRWVRSTGHENPAKRTAKDAVATAFRTVLDGLGINGRRNFYAVRHTFRTVRIGRRINRPSITSWGMCGTTWRACTGRASRVTGCGRLSTWSGTGCGRVRLPKVSEYLNPQAPKIGAPT